MRYVFIVVTALSAAVAGEQELIVVRMQSKPFDQQAPYEPEALRLFDQLIR